MFFAVLFAATLAGTRVDIRESPPRYVLNDSELQRLCSTNHWRTVYACTLFPEERLECHCRERGGLWYPYLVAHLVPVVLLSHPRYRPHEQEHLDDIRTRLDDWIAGAGALGYQSRLDCERAANAHVSLFPELMNRIRQASNERVH